MKNIFVTLLVLATSMLQAHHSHHSSHSSSHSCHGTGPYKPVQTLVDDPSIPAYPGGDFFGNPNFMTKEFAFVDAPHASVNDIILTGAVYVFKKNCSNQWEQTQILNLNGVFNEIGVYQIYSYGKWLFLSLIGTPAGNTDPYLTDQTGSIVIYTLDHNGLWQFYQSLDNSTPGLTGLVPEALFGLYFAVDEKNDLILGGAQYQSETDPSGNVLSYAGAVYAFRLQNNQWTYFQTITSPIGNFYSETFGASMVIHDKVALISNSPEVAGPRVNLPENSGNGSVYVYRYHDGQWKYLQRVQGDQKNSTLFEGTPIADNFGSSLALNHEWAAIGANFETQAPNTPPFNGALYFFKVKEKNGKPKLVRHQKFFSDDPASQGFPYFDVLLQGKHAYASDPLRTGPTGNAAEGGAIVYHEKDGRWHQDRVIYDPNGAPYEFFGAGLSGNKKYLMLGTSNAFYEQFGAYIVPPLPSFTLLPGKAIIYRKPK